MFPPSDRLEVICVISNIASAQIKGPLASLKQLQRHRPETLLTFRVAILSQALSRLVDTAVGEELGLSSRQWRILMILNRDGPMSSGEVARRASYDHSQVSRAAYELTTKGLIAQTEDAEDRRRQRLSVTEAGTEVLRAGIIGSMEREKRLRGALTEEEYKVFCKAAATLTEEAQAMVAERKLK